MFAPAVAREDPLRGAELGWAQPTERAGSLARRLGLLGVAALGLALLAFAFVPFVLTAIDAAGAHRVFLGASGFFPIDQLQYLGFVGDAHSGLIRNLFGLTGSAVFVDPMWSPAGIAQGLTGIGPVAIMAVSTLVGASVLLGGAWRLVTSHVPPSRPARRVVALALALFGGLTPVLALLYHNDARWVGGFALDLVPAITAWGYAPTAVAVGLMPFAILGMEQILAGTASRRVVLTTVACGLLIGWLHPWQAATLLVVLAGLATWRSFDSPVPGGVGARVHGVWLSLAPCRGRLGAAVAGLLAGPIYFALLGRLDYSWGNFSRADSRLLMISWPVFEYALLPLILIALVGIRAARHDTRARSLILWICATFIVLALRPPEQFHALDGVALPLGVLTAHVLPDCKRLSIRSLVTGSLLASIIATAVLFGVQLLRYSETPAVRQYTELSTSDVRAVKLAAASDHHTMILTTAELGAAVPALADTPTWAGDPLWTPGGFARDAAADAFVANGESSPGKTRAFLSATGARAVVQPCGYTYDLEPVLAPLGFSERTVGCAHVYLPAE